MSLLFRSEAGLGKTGKLLKVIIILQHVIMLTSAIHASGGSSSSDKLVNGLWVQFNGVNLVSGEQSLEFYPGRQNVLTFENTVAQGIVEVEVEMGTPSGRQQVFSAEVIRGNAAHFELGPMLDVPQYRFKAGIVLRKGYQLNIAVTDKRTGASLYNGTYHQGLAEKSTDWRNGRPMLSGPGVLQPGDEAWVPYNPRFGVEPAVGLRLARAVLDNQDNVVIQARLNPGAPVDTLEGYLVAEEEGGVVLWEESVVLEQSESWQSVSVGGASEWPPGSYRIAFLPSLGGKVWEEGPALSYHRLAADEMDISIATPSPWTLRRDPSRPVMEVSDFTEVMRSRVGPSGAGKWLLKQTDTGAKLAYPVVEPGQGEALELNLGVVGMYAIFAESYRDGCLIKLEGEEWARPVTGERGLVFVTAGDLTDAALHLFPFELHSASNDLKANTGLARLKLIPVQADSVELFRKETMNPPVPLYGVTDWPDILHVPIRVHDDQFAMLAGGQRELGLSVLDWSIGRSWLEYHTSLPDRNLFPVVPLEEALKSNPRAMFYLGRTLFINNLACPLRTVLDSREGMDVQIWSWLAMNRHYGPGAHGGLFTSEWFLAHPEWRRWRKNADAADRGEVSYFFEEVRRERVEILLETAELGLDGIVVGATRQVPMLLYNPEMVAAYKEETGIDPLKIDAGDGALYEDWIRWRADHFTEVLRMLREGLAGIEEEQGRRIPVAVRIPSAGLFYNLAQGLDVEQWLAEGLVDKLQLNPLEDRGGRGSHDVSPYIALGKEYGIPVIGGVGASGRYHPAALRRAIGLVEAGVDGIELYATEYAVFMSNQRWLIPLMGNPDRAREFLDNSNFEACIPLTDSSVMAGYDNHSSWSEHGYNVEGLGRNSL